jgi:methylenetetrahydrofolate reductase (NADPH)
MKSGGSMRIIDILKEKTNPVSLEFFPPKNEKSWENLFQNIHKLQNLNPAYVSVTYGAGGSTRERTHELVCRIKRDVDIDVVAHLTCVGSTKDEVASILDDYDQAGIHNILALRGDLPIGIDHCNPNGKGFDFAADLVGFILKRKPHFCVAVAGFPEGHPEAFNRLKEMDYLKAKVDQGAHYMVTQLFFDNRDYYDFYERCQIKDIKIPIVAGVMPISSIKSMEKMAELAANCRFPASLLRSLYRAEKDGSVEKAGIHWATEQVRDLMDHNVEGIHLYTLNHSTASIEICENLGLHSFS